MDKNFFNDYFDDEEDNENDELNYDDEYEDEMRHNNKTNGKTFTKGFLTALAICVVAIGAAVWTTINNVNSYLNPDVKTEVASDTDRDSTKVEVSSQASYVVESEAQVNATVKKEEDTVSGNHGSQRVVFTYTPVSGGKVICDYSENPVYNETLGDYRAHPAIDYAADVDTKVRCMGSGVVKDIYYDDMLGNVVVVEHSESVSSFYCGLAKTTLVQKGEVISAGDFVGTVYAIPAETSSQSHIHIAVKKDGEWISAEDFMKSNEN